jgi:hypothetical protein
LAKHLSLEEWCVQLLRLMLLVLHVGCTHPIDLMGIHFLHCAHGNERIGTHDVIHNTSATIVQNVGFHMGQEHLHVLP